MGLHKSDSIAAIVIGVAALAGAWGDAGREMLRYDRDAIAGGEAWRLVSGHFVHLGWSHFALNAAGLALVWFLFRDGIGAARWVAVIAVNVAAISAGFWFLDPQLQWYVGLSGLLHGMLAAGIVVSLGAGRHDAILLLVLVTAKLVYEQLLGPMPGSEGASGGAVIVNAHLYGAVAGAVTGAIIRGLQRK